MPRSEAGETAEPPDRDAHGDAAPATPAADGDRATRVVLSYPADLSDWSRRQLETRWFRAYLRKTLGRVAVGDAREEFVDVGCCGRAHDVPLRVEAVEGGTVVGPDTPIEYATREACGVESGWRVQSAAGPTH